MFSVLPLVKLASLFSAVVGFSSYSVSLAAVVNLDGRLNGPTNPVSVTLDAGFYRVEPVSSPNTAYSFVEIPEECAPDGSCKLGWSTTLGFAVPVEGGFRATEPGVGDFATPELAFANRPAAYFSLDRRSDVLFYIPDGYTEDNLGGLSLGVDLIPTPDSEASPLLPTRVVDGRFEFLFTPDVALIPRVWIDPVVAEGYEYSIYGASVDSITAPSLGLVPDEDGYLIRFDAFELLLGPGETLLLDYPINFFGIYGINPALGLDPENPLAFPLGLSFAEIEGRDIQITQTPVSVQIPPVPLSGSAWALISALLMFLFLARRNFMFGGRTFHNASFH